MKKVLLSGLLCLSLHAIAQKGQGQGWLHGNGGNGKHTGWVDGYTSTEDEAPAEVPGDPDATEVPWDDAVPYLLWAAVGYELLKRRKQQLIKKGAWFINYQLI